MQHAYWCCRLQNWKPNICLANVTVYFSVRFRGLQAWIARRSEIICAVKKFEDNTRATGRGNIKKATLHDEVLAVIGRNHSVNPQHAKCSLPVPRHAFVEEINDEQETPMLSFPNCHPPSKQQQVDHFVSFSAWRLRTQHLTLNRAPIQVSQSPMTYDRVHLERDLVPLELDMTLLILELTPLALDQHDWYPTWYFR